MVQNKPKVIIATTVNMAVRGEAGAPLGIYENTATKH